MNIKNILLIGRTGSGKSTLANTLINQGSNFEEVFKESSGSVSETKHIQHQEFIVEISSTEKIRYLVVGSMAVFRVSCELHTIAEKLMPCEQHALLIDRRV